MISKLRTNLRMLLRWKKKEITNEQFREFTDERGFANRSFPDIELMILEEILQDYEYKRG